MIPIVRESGSIADREEGLGEVEKVAPPPKPVPGAPEKHRQEVVSAGRMRGRIRGQLQIGKDIWVELQIPPSPNDSLTTPTGGFEICVYVNRNNENRRNDNSCCIGSFGHYLHIFRT